MSKVLLKVFLFLAMVVIVQQPLSASKYSLAVHKLIKHRNEQKAKKATANKTENTEEKSKEKRKHRIRHHKKNHHTKIKENKDVPDASPSNENVVENLPVVDENLSSDEKKDEIELEVVDVSYEDIDDLVEWQTEQFILESLLDEILPQETEIESEEPQETTISLDEEKWAEVVHGIIDFDTANLYYPYIKIIFIPALGVNMDGPSLVSYARALPELYKLYPRVLEKWIELAQEGINQGFRPQFLRNDDSEEFPTFDDFRFLAQIDFQTLQNTSFEDQLSQNNLFLFHFTIEGLNPLSLLKMLVEQGLMDQAEANDIHSQVRNAFDEDLKPALLNVLNALYLDDNSPFVRSFLLNQDEEVDSNQDEVDSNQDDWEKDEFDEEDEVLTILLTPNEEEVIENWDEDLD